LINNIYLIQTGYERRNTFNEKFSFEVNQEIQYHKNLYDKSSEVYDQLVNKMERVSMNTALKS